VKIRECEDNPLITTSANLLITISGNLRKSAGKKKVIPLIAQMNADKDAEKRSAKICGRENYPADHANGGRKEICENLREKTIIPRITQMDYR